MNLGKSTILFINSQRISIKKKETIQQIRKRENETQKKDRRTIAAFLFLHSPDHIEFPPGMQDPEWIEKNILVLNLLNRLYLRVTSLAKKIVNEY
jgi:hypothetical protein